VGSEVDRRDKLRSVGQREALEDEDSSSAVRPMLPELLGEYEDRSWSREPRFEVSLPGMAVVHKPPDWEVDGRARAEAEEQQQQEEDAAFFEGTEAASQRPTTSLSLRLSSWLRAALPWCSLARDAALDFGFLHRLDVPSSGLILCGTSFSGLFALRWQLDTYRIERQYIVFGHGLAPRSLNEVVGHIDPRTLDSRRSFVDESRGKPAKTWFAIVAHLRLAAGGGPRLRTSATAFAVRIRTGRRHQIRAHLRHSGHATVTDCKYAAPRVGLFPLAAYELDFLRAGCPDTL